MATERRLIDANALIAELDKFGNPVPNKSGYDFLCGVATAITEIEESPTINAVEVVHGRWLNSHTVAFTEECSQCGFCVPWDDYGWLHKYKYCPNCGAKMDGDGNE